MIEDDELLIFLKRSKLRANILKKINEKPQIASFLACKMKKHREVISRIFLKLQEKGLAKCKNPTSRNFRFYEITKKGKDAIKLLNYYK
jgi:predicted transcriptional regulator